MNCMVEIKVEEAQPQLHVGKVKWFSNAKGFGFLTCDDYEDDILLHANTLGKFAGRAIPSGADVEFVATQGKHGAKATQIVSMALAPSEETDPMPEEVTEITLQSARVKWFDQAKGYGFANCFGKPGDVFLHAHVVNKVGQWDLHEGEAVTLRVKDTERGMIAVDVRPWDEALLVA